MHFFRIPSWLQLLCPSVVWHGSRDDKQVFLTFDDGPVPGITDFVLEELAKWNMKATFFMVGENVSRHPGLAREVVAMGHGIGNHTYNHLNGVNTDATTYLQNVALCQEQLAQNLGVVPALFRPPYGRLTAYQRRTLRESYEIVLWEILSGDYLDRLPEDLICRKIQEKTRSGSIVLFHDQEKTARKVKKVLPDYLAFLDGEGFQVKPLEV
ncbi:polysaccharide deacetylase family protein [Lunatimonas salinarum]|uniref:polysaccharide deacetylase family protein n=1 Tax=Lunatimonas salinarum TaxID=1774590 RepID=UPI001ADF4C4B|nr:polysaccharide deacetylase family protein [Lunatimonas salinarum]